MNLEISNYFDSSEIVPPEELLELHQSKMTGFGKPLSNKTIDKLKNILKFQLDRRPYDKGLLIHNPAGSGKSVFIADSTAYLGNYHLGSVGGVIIKSKREEVKEFCETVNEMYWSNKVAYPFLPPIKNGDKQIHLQLEEQKEFPFIVMTLEKYKRMVALNQLDLIDTYEVGTKEVPRQLLIIDEAPSQFVNYEFNKQDLTFIEEMVDELEDKKRISEEDSDLMWKAIRELRKLLRRAETGEGHTALSPSFKIPPDVRKAWKEVNASDDSLSRLEAFEKVVSLSADVSTRKDKETKNNKVTLQVVDKVKLDTYRFKALCFDASTHIDPEVTTSQWEMLSYHFNGDEYINLTVTRVKGLNCSLNDYQREGFIQELAEAIKKLYDSREIEHKDITILTYKDHLDELRTEVEKLFEGTGVKIRFKYADGGRGTNEYQSSTLLFACAQSVAHTNVYKKKLKAIDPRIETTETGTKNSGAYFRDPVAQELFEKTIATSNYQELNRIRPFNSDVKKEIVCFYNDNGIFEKSIEEFSSNGATVVEEKINKSWFAHLEKKDKLTDTERKLLSYFKGLPECEIKKKDACEVVGCDTKTLARAIKKKHFFEECKKLGVTFTKHTIKRELED